MCDVVLSEANEQKQTMNCITKKGALVAVFAAFSLLIASCGGGESGTVGCMMAAGACAEGCVEVSATAELGSDEQCYVELDVLLGCVAADEVPEHEGGCPGIAPGCIESQQGIRYIEGSCQPRLEGFVDCDVMADENWSQAQCESQ